MREVCPDTRDARVMESLGEDGGDPGGKESISNQRGKKNTCRGGESTITQFSNFPISLCPRF